MQKTYPIKGMHGVGCAKSIESSVNKIDGVSATVSFANNKLIIQSGEEKYKEINKAVMESGYELVYKDIKKIKQNAIYSIIIAVIVVGLSMTKIPYANYINLALSLIIIYIGRQFYVRAYKQIKKFSVSTDSLIALGVSTAWIYSLYASIFSKTTYFDSTAAIIALILLGKYFEARAKNSAGDSIRELVKLKPESAILLKGKKEIEIKVEEIRIGDKLRVLPGQKIPADGIILRGESTVDESMITGESISIEKSKRDKVIAGTINKYGTFVMKAKKIGESTMLHQIIEQVESAQVTKAPIQRIADKISGIFVPIVLLISISSFIFWQIIGVDFNFSILAAVSVLIIACPSALGLATPTAVLVATSKGAKEGILLKTASALENLSKTKYLVFDKTGTLTKGELKVTKIYSEDVSEAVVLRLAGSLESNSKHPIAKAIINEAKENKVKLGRVSHFEEIPGKGLQGKLSSFISVGTLSYMKEKEVKLGPYRARAEKFEEEANTVIYVARQKKVIGIIAVSDTEKADAKKTIREVIEMGIIPVMITGDNPITAEAVAERLGIKKVYSQIDPIGKASVIKELQEDGITAFVGDGINDAIALTQADVGIAIGTGTDIAIDASDITIVKGNLSEVKKALDLSISTMSTIKQNLVFAFSYNILAIPIAAGVLYPAFGLLLNPMIASAAMALCSLSVVSNSLRN